VKDQVYKQLLDDVYRTGNRFVSPELPSPFIVKVMEVFVNLYMSHCVKPMELFWRDGVADEITDQVNARKAVEVRENVLTNNMPQNYQCRCRGQYYIL
jgi:hypothetical protein